MPRPSYYGLQIASGILSIGTLVAPEKYTFATSGYVKFIVIMCFLITSFFICLKEFVEHLRYLGEKE